MSVDALAMPIWLSSSHVHSSGEYLQSNQITSGIVIGGYAPVPLDEVEGLLATPADDFAEASDEGLDNVRIGPVAGRLGI